MRPLALVLLAACGGSDHAAVPPKPPNNQLVLGEFARRPPDGTTAARFRADGSITVAHDRNSLDTKPLATGTFQLQGDQLTLTYQTGQMCPAGSTGTYRVVISKVGIHFTKVADDCADRAQIDGQTWFRQH
ncbi:MAG TPA: hypothetical protein VMJ10_07040 [Kofleriaceae bacterium]|nr:hypothetical protein [Kofleriaceae bacterium]